MLVCHECKKEMQCLKNSVGLDYGNCHVYPGDAFGCKECKKVVIKARSQSIHDRNYRSQEKYVTVNVRSAKEISVTADVEKQFQPKFE